MATQQVGCVAIVVTDYDEAKRWFCERLGFIVVEDIPISDDKRWVVVAPPHSTGTSLLLATASNDRQRERIGDQTSNRWDLPNGSTPLHPECSAGSIGTERKQRWGVPPVLFREIVFRELRALISATSCLG